MVVTMAFAVEKIVIAIVYCLSVVMIMYDILCDCEVIYRVIGFGSSLESGIATDSSAISVAILGSFLRIQVNTLNRWGHVETWGTDKQTYPSKNVKDEETLGKCTDVRGIVPPENACLGTSNMDLVSNELE